MIMDVELCDKGKLLWDALRKDIKDIFNWYDSKGVYRDYVVHITACPICQKGLDIDDNHVELLKKSYKIP